MKQLVAGLLTYQIGAAMLLGAAELARSMPSRFSHKGGSQAMHWLKQRMPATKADIAELERKIMLSQADIDALKAKVDAMEPTVAAVAAELPTITTSLGTLETNYATVQQELATLQQQNPTLDITGLSDAIDTLSAGLAPVKTSVDAINTTLNPPAPQTGTGPTT